MDLESNGQSSSPLKPVESGNQSVQDACDLAALGHDQSLVRKFDIWSMSSLAFCVLGTWSTFAQDLDSGLNNGGAVSLLWGLCVVTACNMCVGLSMGELASSMPTALGQAYWVARLWQSEWGRFTSYMCAWINTFGWWTLCASQMAFMTNFLLGMKTMFAPDWAGASEGWLEFVIYLGLVALMTAINVVACRKEKILPWLNNFVGVWFAGLFVVFSLAFVISVGIKEPLTYQPASFAFGKWINQTGWSDGVVWFTGLVQAAYGLTAFDSVIHMIEEIPAPRQNAPKVIVLSISFGAITGWIFMLVCLFCIQDVYKVAGADLPFMELVEETIGVNGGAVLIALFIFNGLGQAISLFTTASRLTWGFARDGGLPFSRYLTHVDTYWKVPARALWFQGFLIALVGILYLFANTVLDAILSVSTIALTISYGIPIFALLMVGRSSLPAAGTFRLGRLGATLNWVSVAYCCVTTVFFFFPSDPNPAPGDMNYAIAVFGVMLVISFGFWFVGGGKGYLRTEDAIGGMLLAQQLENEVEVVNEQGPRPGDGKK